MLWWWSVACVHRKPDPAVRAQELLGRADQAWGRRGETGYDEASRPLLEAYGLSPNLPGVAWRLARWRLGEGLAAEDRRDAKSSFAEARSSAVGCLEQDPAFVARLPQGWTPALADLGPDRSACEAWAALAWVRWLEIEGPAAASLDLEAIDALVAAASKSTDPDVHSITVWASGLTAALRPTWSGQDLVRARTDLEDAVRADPDALVRQVDLYALVIEPTGSPDERNTLLERILAAPITNPEDSAARARVEVAPAEPSP